MNTLHHSRLTIYPPQLNVLKWAMANKIISKDDISTIAALNNQPEVLKWTLELGMLPNFVGHEILRSVQKY